MKCSFARGEGSVLFCYLSVTHQTERTITPCLSQRTGTYPWMQRNISRACDCAVRRLNRRLGGVLGINKKRPGNAFSGKSAAHGSAQLQPLQEGNEAGQVLQAVRA